MTKKKQEENNDGDGFSVFLGGFFVGAILILFIFGTSGVLNNKMDRLDLDKDLLAEHHVLKYYPEYENCTFKYKLANQVECEYGVSGVEIFCGDIGDRDGMIAMDSNLELTLCFDKISIEEIFDSILEDYK